MTKVIDIKKIFPVYAVEQNAMVSVRGDLTIAYEVSLPEIFTLSDRDYEGLHQAIIKAIKVLPSGTVFHKQDWFTLNRYAANLNAGQSFLSRSSEAFFDGRPYLDHRCFIFLTRKPDRTKTSSSLYSGLLRKSIVPPQVLESGVYKDLLDRAGQFERILSDSGLVQLRRLTDEELSGTGNRPGILEKYCFLQAEGEKIIRDVDLKGGLRVGDNLCKLFTLADTAELPPLCGSRINYDKFSTDRSDFSVGFAASVGQLLNCNHIYNQYLFLEDAGKTLKRLEAKKRRLQSLAAYSRENSIARDAVNDFLNEAISAQRVPIKAHFNVLAWSDDGTVAADLRNKVSAALAQMDAVAKQETAGAPQIWWAGIPGNAGDFPMNDTFDTFLEQGTCLLNLETGYSSDPAQSGIRFCDRLSGKPVFVDLFDAPRTKGITSNMGMLVCGTSGGGKSMTVNHILRTLYDEGAHCVTVDIGGSYKALCELVGGYYFTYQEDDPIRFNPFYIPPGERLDTEKKESLKALLVTLWKQENERFNRSEYVALSNALQGYYQFLAKQEQVFPCFNTFYDYLETQYVEILKSHKVKDKDFDIDNFLYVLRPYYAGGEFDYLLNGEENLDLLDQRFVVIELDTIKDHPILFPVVTLIIMEMFLSKMRKLAGIRKVLTIDEAWKAIANSGMAGFIQYAFKTMRKFNGIPNVVTQELDDLISSPIIKDAIINNADIKILMDMRKFLNKFDKLQDTLGMSGKGKIQVLSVNKEDREIYVDLGGQVMKVYRNELCQEELYAYTTEGQQRVKVMESARKHGSMEKGIKALVREERASKKNEHL